MTLLQHPLIRDKLKQISKEHPTPEGGAVYRRHLVNSFAWLADEVTCTRKVHVAVIDEAKMAKSLDLLQKAKLAALDAVVEDFRVPPKGYYQTWEHTLPIIRVCAAACVFYLVCLGIDQLQRAGVLTR